jgi:hypothetical protein
MYLKKLGKDIVIENYVVWLSYLMLPRNCLWSDRLHSTYYSSVVSLEFFPYPQIRFNVSILSFLTEITMVNELTFNSSMQIPTLGAVYL